MAGNGLGMTTNLDALNMQLKETDKLFAAGVKKRLRDAVSLAGTDLVSAIKAEASWSRYIPAATSIAMTFGAKRASIRIRVDRKKAPHARGLEFGNSTAFSEKVINANGGYRMVTFVDKKTGKRTTRNVAVRRGIYQAIRKSGVGSTRTLRCMRHVDGQGRRSGARYDSTSCPTSTSRFFACRCFHSPSIGRSHARVATRVSRTWSSRSGRNMDSGICH